MLLIVTEKPSAAQNFAKALGGKSGTFNGEQYEIIALAGHVMQYVSPENMVAKDKVEQYKSWDIKYLPWNLKEMSFDREVAQGKGKLVAALKSASKRADTLVIATDVDPSGEGELIAMEAFKEIGWRGKIERMYFVDESVKQIQKAFKSRRDVSNSSKNGDYLKAETRSMWDFASMQVVRIATSIARQLKLRVVLRNGRLKSVMNRLVFLQEEAIRKYKRTPYYEAQFKDDNGHVYKRKFKDGDDWRFASESEVPLSLYHTSAVTEDGRTRKESAPPKLLDIMSLAAILAPKGYSPKKVSDVYQKMYDAKIVSYPRTEDSVISVEQFNDMLSLVDSIAKVVGVDVSLLTHRQQRSTHVKDGGSHGANRPGEKVPKSLAELAVFDNGSKGIASAIYETLAKNFLAMFAENYVYDSVSGHVVDYPDFKTTFSIPVSQGWKRVYNEVEDDDVDDDTASKGIGTSADPFIAEGANSKPATPTIKWLKNQLKKYDVGTGATRTSTIAEMTTDKEDRRLLDEKRGRLSTTLIGKVNAVLLKDTWIASPEITQELFQNMEAVGQFQKTVDEVVATVTKLVKHDLEVMEANEGLALKYIESVLSKGGKDADKFNKLKTKAPVQKVKGFYKGKEVEFYNSVMGVYQPTEEERNKALSGGEFVIDLISKKTKKPYKGRIGFGYDDKYGYGFKYLGPVVNGPAKVDIEFEGQMIQIKPAFGSYQLSNDELQCLARKEEVRIKTKTAKGTDWEPSLEIVKDPNWGWCVTFKKSASKAKGKPERPAMKPEFSGYKFSEDEKDHLYNGGSTPVTLKSGKKAFVKWGETSFKSKDTGKTVKYYGYYVDEWM